MLLRKQNFYEGIKNPILIITFGSRSGFKNKANKSKNPIDIAKFKRQQNLLANVNKQAKL